MDLINEIEKLENIEDLKEKIIIIEEIGDEYEYNDLEEGIVIKSINKLLELGLQENDKELKEVYFHTINNAVIYKDVATKVCFDKLVSNLNMFNDEILDYALGFLGFSKNKKYINIIEKYLNYTNVEIVESARESLNNMYGQIRY